MRIRCRMARLKTDQMRFRATSSTGGIGCPRMRPRSPDIPSAHRGTAVFQVGTLVDGSLVAFDGDQSQPRVVYIAGAPQRRRISRPIHKEQ
jgi:hypothetical protein